MERPVAVRFGAQWGVTVLLAMVGGAASALFLARLLAEETAASWPWQPLPVAGLAACTALLAGAAVSLVSRTSRNRDVGGAGYAGRLTAVALAFCIPAIYLSQRTADGLQARILLGSVVATTALVATIASAGSAETRVERRLAGLVAVVLACLPLAVYLGTLSPTVGEADSFEFQVTASRLGVAHPTGYPLYILLGRLFIFLPIGGVAYRVNLTSAVLACLAVLVVYLIVLRLIGRREAALVAALAFAFSRTFWSQAVIAEVYTLNAFLVALLLYLTFAADTSPAAGERWLPFVLGLSLTNHLTTVLLLPGIVAYRLWPRLASRLQRGRAAASVRPFGGPAPGRSLRRGLGAAGLFLLGLSVYLYIPLRWPALNNGRRMALREFAAWVTGYRFRGALQLGAWLHDPVRYRILGRLVLAQYGWVGTVVAVVGLAWVLRRRPRLGVSLILVWAAYAFYGLNYIVSDVSVFLIPAHMVMAIGLGAALAALSRRLEPTKPSLPALLALLGALLPLSLACSNWHHVDRSRAGWGMLRWGRGVLQLPLPRRAAILADSEKIAPLYYLQTVEGMRPDLDIAVLGDEAGYRRALEERLAEGREVYLARFLPGLEAAYHLQSLGPLVEVGTRPLAATPAIEHPLRARFGSGISLLGFSAGDLAVRRGDALHLTLYWRADAPAGGHYQVRLRLVGARGHTWWERSAYPVHGSYPTGAWKPGEIIVDTYEVPFDPGLPPGRYRLEAGLFPPFSDQGLPIAGSGGRLLPLAAVEALEAMGGPAVQAGDAQPLRARFGPLMLVGADYPAVARPEGRLPVTLHWRRLGPCTDYEVVLEAVDEDGRVLSTVAEQPFYGEWPTSLWPREQTVATTHVLRAPSAGGRLRLRIGLRDPASGRSVTVLPGWLARPTERYTLGTVQLQGTPLPEGAVDFGDRIHLLGWELRERTLHPGDALDLLLTWQCASAMPEDYTVFVHILDGSEHVRGQVDVWPVQGTHPTSQWVEGEMVRDAYSVRLDSDAPPGEYRLEVGWYLLSTMERLLVLDEQSRPVENRVVIGGIEVLPRQ